MLQTAAAHATLLETALQLDTGFSWRKFNWRNFIPARTVERNREKVT